MTNAEWVAKIRASERAEWDAKDKQWMEAERRQDRGICAFCRRKYAWGQAVMNRARRPVWIPEAGKYGHPACYEAFKEKR